MPSGCPRSVTSVPGAAISSSWPVCRSPSRGGASPEGSGPRRYGPGAAGSGSVRWAGPTPAFLVSPGVLLGSWSSRLSGLYMDLQFITVDLLLLTRGFRPGAVQTVRPSAVCTCAGRWGQTSSARSSWSWRTLRAVAASGSQPAAVIAAPRTASRGLGDMAALRVSCQRSPGGACRRWTCGGGAASRSRGKGF